jgi:tryptophan-rich sensory protein
MSNIADSRNYRTHRQVTATLFVFFVSSLPVFFAPFVFSDHAWFTEINWPEFTPSARMWMIAYLIFHLLFAFQVSDEYELYRNKNALYMWFAQVGALTLVMYATFSLRNFAVVALFDLILVATGVGLYLVSHKRNGLSALRTLPFSAYYCYAAYFAWQTSGLN